MPELPDLTVYQECIEAKACGEPLQALRIGNPFVLRTARAPAAGFAGRRLQRVGRLGKRLVLEFDGGWRALVHLMILGRFRWQKAGAAIPRAGGLAAFDFPGGTLLLVESGKKRRAALHLLDAGDDIAPFRRAGIEPLHCGGDAFAAALRSENHTLKRALTDPDLVAGVGNAYSDEILHRARMSPFRQTRALDDDEMQRLHAATVAVLTGWTTRLRREAAEAGGWPVKVTAFRPEMAVHGRYRQPCPDCGAPVQRIVWSENESNYCAHCQTGGRILADRALSRLLRDSFPKTLEEWER